MQEKLSEHEKSHASTRDDTLDDLFDSFNEQVEYDLQIKSRPNYSEQPEYSHIEETEGVPVALGASNK